MRFVLAVAAFVVALPEPAAAHCYTIWHYKTPRRCGVQTSRSHFELSRGSKARNEPAPVLIGPSEEEMRAWAIDQLKIELKARKP